MVVTAAGASQLDALRGVGDGRRTNAAPIIVAMAGKQKPTREVAEAVVHEFACQAAGSCCCGTTRPLAGPSE